MPEGRVALDPTATAEAEAEGGRQHSGHLLRKLYTEVRKPEDRVSRRHVKPAESQSTDQIDR